MLCLNFKNPSTISIPSLCLIKNCGSREDLSRSIQGNRHIALLTDNAGWHTAKKLTVPSNITLISLPPYAPELNAMEQVWEWIKNHFLSNQCYGVYEDIVTMACYAWNQLAHNVDLVKSIMYRDWIHTPC